MFQSLTLLDLIIRDGIMDVPEETPVTVATMCTVERTSVPMLSTESQNCWAWKGSVEIISSNPTAKARSSRAGYTIMCLRRF